MQATARTIPLALLIALGLPACARKPPAVPELPPTLPVLVAPGNRFFAAGRDVSFQQAIVCCSGYPENGWPFVSESQLRLFGEAGINATHIRLGPFTRHGEPGAPGSPPFDTYQRDVDGRYDLARFDEAFWQRAQSVVRLADHHGVYVEVDLVDHWVRQHGCPEGGPCDRASIDPWNARNNAKGEEHGGLAIFSRAPDSVHEAFVRKAVASLGRYSNVIFSTGNEAFKFRTASGSGCQDAPCVVRPSDIGSPWEAEVARIVRDELAHRGIGPRLIGSSSEDPEIERGPWLDYVIRHRATAQDPETKPVIVNEHPALSAAEVLARVRGARALGTYFGYFRGAHDDETWRETLRRIGAERGAGAVRTGGLFVGPPPRSTDPAAAHDSEGRTALESAAPRTSGDTFRR
jgi:hypothetical protein